MNTKELAKELLNEQDYQELTDALQMLDDRKYKDIYNLYASILSEFASLYSYYELRDFLKGTTLSESLFIFGFLWQKKQCIQIGGYEESIQDKINLFIDSKAHCIESSTFAAANIFTDFDGEDNFMDYIAQLNLLVSAFGLEIVVFFNDLYSACSFYIIVIDADIAETVRNNWKDDDIIIHR